MNKIDVKRTRWKPRRISRTSRCLRELETSFFFLEKRQENVSTIYGSKIFPIDLYKRFDFSDFSCNFRFGCSWSMYEKSASPQRPCFSFTGHDHFVRTLRREIRRFETSSRNQCSDGISETASSTWGEEGQLCFIFHSVIVFLGWWKRICISDFVKVSWSWFWTSIWLSFLPVSIGVLEHALLEVQILSPDWKKWLKIFFEVSGFFKTAQIFWL